MHKKTNFSFILLLLFPYFLAAQFQTLRGSIRDKQSEMPLIGATVQLLTTTTSGGETSAVLGAVSDENGLFTLKKVPVGRQTLRVVYFGYEPQTVPNILVTA